MKFIVDADDFFEGNDALWFLHEIKKQVPDFKITLFTILGRCSPEFIEEVKKIDWIDMCPHGWMHETSRECENWSYRSSDAYLTNIEKYGLTKIFKAPGWQVSDSLFLALRDHGYSIADQAYNDSRRPEGLKAYILDSPYKLHYHIGHTGGNNANEIQLFKDDLLSLKNAEFDFIKNVI